MNFRMIEDRAQRVESSVGAIQRNFTVVVEPCDYFLASDPVKRLIVEGWQQLISECTIDRAPSGQLETFETLRSDKGSFTTRLWSQPR